VAVKEPKVRRDVEFCKNVAFAMFAAIARDVGDTVHHQHGRSWQLGIAFTEEFAARTFQ
jgi:hypothetical protein